MHPATEIDLFLESPIDFEAAYARAVRREAATGIMATFCSLEDLIKMKTLSGRPEDRTDIEKLTQWQRTRMSKIPEKPFTAADLVWEEGWEAHSRKQMQRLAALPLSEKLAWLEEAHRLVMSLQSRPDDSGKIGDPARQVEPTEFER